MLLNGVSILARLPDFDVDNLSAAQQQVYNAIMSGPRGKFGGPFPALLECPGIADQVQALGGALRFEGKLSAALREVAILVIGRHWNSDVEWNAHVVIAEREGVERSVIEAILHNREAEGAADDVQVVIAVCREINETKFVSDATYQRAVELIGLGGVVELTVLAGYFALLSMVLNTFEVAPADVDGVPPEGLQLPPR